MEEAQAVTHRRVLSLAVPMTLSQLTTPLLGFVSTTAIGRLGDPALLGAIALGGVTFGFLFWTFGALRMATTGLVAQAVGRGDARESDRILARALMLALVIGALLVACQAPIGAAAAVMAGGSPAVTRALHRYFSIRIYAAPFTLGNYAILGSTLGRGRADWGLALQAGINLLNVALTVLLVSVLRLGIAGAAAATLGAEVGGVALGVLVLLHLGARPWRATWADLTHRESLWRMLAVNRDVMLRTAALMSAFALFAAVGARAGDTTLAANAVLENVFLIGGYFLDGFATAAETLCGQALGAGRIEPFRAAARLCLRWSLAFGLAISAAFWAVGDSFIAVMSTSSDVRAVAIGFLPYAALTPLLGATAFAFDGIFIGATWSGAMRNIMLAAFAVYLVTMVSLRPLGNAGLWLALLIFLAARGLGQALLYPGLLQRTFTPVPTLVRT